MRNEPVGFNGVDKSFGGLLFPMFKYASSGKLVKSIVYLHRGKVQCVFFEPACGRAFFRIKKSLPMIIVPAGTADINFCLFHYAPLKKTKGARSLKALRLNKKT